MYDTYMTLSKLPALVALGLAVLPSSAFDPKERDCGGGICLTSFRWCQDDGKSEAVSNCQWPEKTRPLHSSVPIAVIDTSQVYTITWKNADPKYPVSIDWRVRDGHNDWSVNTTADSFGFRPDSIFEKYPENWHTYNGTSSGSGDQKNNQYFQRYLAQGTSAGEIGRLRISQPEKTDNKTVWEDKSQRFVVYPSDILALLELTEDNAKQQVVNL